MNELFVLLKANHPEAGERVGSMPKAQFEELAGMLGDA